MMNRKDIESSIAGIQRIINVKNAELDGRINFFYGKGNTRFNEQSNIARALQLWRTIRRLRIIKAELNLILHFI